MWHWSDGYLVGIPKTSTDNDRYSGKNGQGFLFHYSGRMLYGTQHISSPLMGEFGEPNELDLRFRL